jgi:hypothetical protein
MTKETEESLRIMAQVVLNTVNHHVKAGSDGVTVDYIFHYFQTAYDEGVRDGAKMIEIQPWEFLTLYASSSTDETLNAASAEGWEFLCPFDGGKVLFRRRKAVAEIAAEEKPE